MTGMGNRRDIPIVRARRRRSSGSLATLLIISSTLSGGDSFVQGCRPLAEPYRGTAPPVPLGIVACFAAVNQNLETRLFKRSIPRYNAISEHVTTKIQPKKLTYPQESSSPTTVNKSPHVMCGRLSRSQTYMMSCPLPSVPPAVTVLGGLPAPSEFQHR